jgi:hypothetical protein
MYTPLKIGDIISPSDDVLDKVWLALRQSAKENLAHGLICEYTHNEAFVRAGLAYEETFTTNVYDRIVDGIWQDDKLAMMNVYGSVSTTHTISAREVEAWSRQDDVIIHSFEELEQNEMRYLYRGAISFKLLCQHELLRPSNFDSTFFFSRQAAYKFAGVQEPTLKAAPARDDVTMIPTLQTP